jgi:hypothetical protein
MKKRPEDKLAEILNQCLRFPANYPLRRLVADVFGIDISVNAPYGTRQETDEYIAGQVDLIRTKGFARWYCGLDIASQVKLAEMMLTRYPEVKKELQ